MRFYSLGSVSWLESQLIYHALPRLEREGLIVLSPASPYVCIGYHQDPTQEVDLAYCQGEGIPVFRREVGGGAVYLDGDQIFYQLVIHRDNPLAPHGKEAFYRKFLQPVVDTYRELGIAAHYRSVNDIVAGGRKISGNGAAEMEGYLILVGNLILDFNYDMMARVLKVPDEKFRDKVYKTMQENLTTIKRELEMVPPRQELERLLMRNFERSLGPLERAGLDESLREMAAQLAERFQSEEWLYQKGRPRRDWATKIAAGVEVKQRAYKAPGGLIRATVVEREGVIDSVSLSGDFFFYPQDRLEDLERALVGVEEGKVEEVVLRFYEENAIESPGVGPADWAQAVTIER